MDLQDYLTNNNKSNESFKTQNFQSQSFQNYHSSFPREGNFNLPNLINGIKNNKKTRNLVIIVAVILLFLAVGLIAILLPLIVKIFNYLTSVGISGLINDVLKFITDLLSATK